MAVFIVINGDSPALVPTPYETKSFCLVGVANTGQGAPPLCVFFATPINSNTVRVFLCGEPKHLSPLGKDDVLDRRNWTIELVSASPPTPERVTEPVITLIENVQPQPNISGPPGITLWSVDIRVDRRLIYHAVYRITISSNVLTADGLNVAPGPPDNTKDFPGIAALRPLPLVRPAQTRRGRDYYYDTDLGVYRLSPDKDVATHTGVDVIKKKIIRRLVTAIGAFFHLPGYGVGLQVKKTFDSNRISEMRLAVDRQIRSEPEVADVQTTVTSPAIGVIIIQLGVKLRSGVEFDLTLQRESDGDTFVIV